MEAATGTAFAHYIRTDRSGARPLPPNILSAWLERGWLQQPSPCDCPEQAAGVVLDPFCGAATVLLVAKRLGRNAIGIELNSDYCEMGAKRLGNQELFDFGPTEEPQPVPLALDLQ
jgi:hypothetical protein